MYVYNFRITQEWDRTGFNGLVYLDLQRNLAVTFKNRGSWLLFEFWINGHKDGYLNNERLKKHIVRMKIWSGNPSNRKSTNDRGTKDPCGDATPKTAGIMAHSGDSQGMTQRQCTGGQNVFTNMG